MPYSAITSRRIPYDIDGTIVGHNSFNTFNNGITEWASSSQLSELNDENLVGLTGSWFSNNPLYKCVWVFFPEKREIELASIICSGVLYEIQGSNNTTNGVDGTWETATYITNPLISPSTYKWREHIQPISFSTSYKCVRMRLMIYDWNYIYSIHFYGRKASGETSDDILFTDINGNELTALMDWGDRQEASEQIKSIKLKNASTTKTANGVNLQLNHADFGMSFSVAGTWTATLDISSIPVGGLSEPIYIKNTIGNPNQILGAKAGRLITTVGSWT
jgi:hypothetical protein